MLLLEIRKILKRKEFKFVSILMFMAVVIDFLVNCYNYYGAPMTNVYSAHTMTVLDNISREPFRVIFVVALPLVASIIASDMYLNDTKLQINSYIITRIHKKKYIQIQALAIFIVVSFTTFFAFLLNITLCIITFPIYGSAMHGITLPYDIIRYNDNDNTYRLFETLAFYHPYINLIFFTVMRSMIAGVFALLSYGISFLPRVNKYIVFVASFFIYNTVNIVELLFENTLFSLNMENSPLIKLAYSGILQLNPIGDIWTYLKDIILYLLICFITLTIATRKEEL